MSFFLSIFADINQCMYEKIGAGSEDFCQIFEENALKNRLSAELYEMYEQHSEIQQYNKGDTLFEDETWPKGIYFIKKGTVKLAKYGSFGKEQILRFVTEGDLVGYRSILCGEAFQAHAEAMSEVEALFIPRNVFMEMLEKDPAFSFYMIKRLAFELGESSNTITFLAQKTVRERLAEVLLLLEQKLGTDPEGFIQITLTREEIANLVGTATESAIRLISEFKNDQLIQVQGRQIKVLNHQMLKKIGHLNS